MVFVRRNVEIIANFVSRYYVFQINWNLFGSELWINMGVKWQGFLKRGVFQRYKGRGLKKFSGHTPPDPTLLPSFHRWSAPPHFETTPQSLVWRQDLKVFPMILVYFWMQKCISPSISLCFAKYGFQRSSHWIKILSRNFFIPVLQELKLFRYFNMTFYIQLDLDLYRLIKKKM